MTPLRTRAIDAVTRETCPGFPAVCWACRDTAERAVDALIAANLLHDQDDEARIERAIVAVNRVRLLPASALNGQSRSEAIARAALAAADQEEQ